MYAKLLSLGFTDKDFTLQDDGDGVVYIKEWKSASPKPTKTAIKNADSTQVLINLAVRPERDRLLADSDWTQMLDCPLSQAQKDAWAVYRQSLRDLPLNITDPSNVIYPATP